MNELREVTPRTCHDCLPGDSPEVITSIHKTVRIGMVRRWEPDGRNMPVYAWIKYENGRLSISGVEGPNWHGGCLGSCGQIDSHLTPELFTSFAPGWDRATVRRFLDVWDKWHLNDMKAGTPAQMVSVEAWKRANPDRSYDYDAVCAHLALHSLLWDWLEPKGHLYPPEYRTDGTMPDGAYKYGSAWLTVEVPQDVLQFLASLPSSDRECPWGDK